MINKYGPLKVGIGGPVGAGKTSLTEASVRLVFPAPTGPPIPTLRGPYLLIMFDISYF